MAKKILIVGGGYAGFYTAWKLEKMLRAGEAEVTIVDPLPYMAYLPFLPEVASGSIEPRHAVVARRRHLNSTANIAGKVTGISHATKTATITPNEGEAFDFEYDSAKYAAKQSVTLTPSLVQSMASAFLLEIEAAGYFAHPVLGPRLVSARAMLPE